MAFNTVSRDKPRVALVTEIRFAVVRIPNGHAGRLKLPPAVLTELGWKSSDRLDVLVGDGDDAGWYALRVVDAKHRARLRVQPNGVGVYTSSVLVPPSVADRKRTVTPEARLGDGEEAGTLYVKLA